MLSICGWLSSCLCTFIVCLPARISIVICLSISLSVRLSMDVSLLSLIFWLSPYLSTTGHACPSWWSVHVSAYIPNSGLSLGVYGFQSWPPHVDLCLLVTSKRGKRPSRGNVIFLSIDWYICFYVVQCHTYISTRWVVIHIHLTLVINRTHPPELTSCRTVSVRDFAI